MWVRRVVSILAFILFVAACAKEPEDAAGLNGGSGGQSTDAPQINTALAVPFPATIADRQVTITHGLLRLFKKGEVHWNSNQGLTSDRYGIAFARTAIHCGSDSFAGNLVFFLDTIELGIRNATLKYYISDGGWVYAGGNTTEITLSDRLPDRLSGSILYSHMSNNGLVSIDTHFDVVICPGTF